MPRTHKRALLRPNAIYFLPPLAVGSVIVGTAVPTPSIIESVNKTVKIGSKCKIVHSKHCRIDKFSSVCKTKLSAAVCNSEVSILLHIQQCSFVIIQEKYCWSCYDRGDSSVRECGKKALFCWRGEQRGIRCCPQKTRGNTWKTRGSVGTFSLWHKGKHAKHAKNAVGIGGQKQMHLVRVDAVG